MENIDMEGYVTGRSQYLDDLPVMQGTLTAAVVASPVAGALLKSLSTAEALSVPGVVRIFTFRDIPGENQIGGILPDEPLLAEEELAYAGQPVALVVASTPEAAEEGRRRVTMEYAETGAVTDLLQAAAEGRFLFPPRTFCSGDTETAFAGCDHLFSGTVSSGGQEHGYLETQGAYVVPGEKGTLLVRSSTQAPTTVQKAIARVLALPMNRVEVDVGRLGGAFGGKEDQATAWAALAALAACLLQKPVKLVLSRHDDLTMTGKRHPYVSDFRIGLSAELKIRAYEVTFYQDGGAAADLSPAILERTLLHATGSYYIPHVRATACSCRTHLPPNTAFRGFGAPQAMFVIEAAITLAAEKLGVPARIIQEKNLLADGDQFPYGQELRDSRATQAWKEAMEAFRVEELARETAAFNRSSPFIKKGLALMPVCFGISFTNTGMNRAQALVHIYQDGSVGVSTGAVEMGQGVNTKLCQLVSGCLGINPGRVRLESTNTTRAANTSPTAASTGTDLNGKAALQACGELLSRLLHTAVSRFHPGAGKVEIRDEQVWFDGNPSAITWPELVQAAHAARVNLSQTGHYATPGIWFDKQQEKGRPFAYYVYGTAVVQVTLDCLRGVYDIDKVQVVHDFGSSLNPAIDIGQVEGALVQGIGWMTCEEVRYAPGGKMLSDSFST